MFITSAVNPFLQIWGYKAHRREPICIYSRTRYTVDMDRYRSNDNIVRNCNYHVVFCPKYRRKVLVDGIDSRFKEIAGEVAEELDFEIREIEVMPDHVHMLISVDPQFGIHRAVKRIKGRTSHDLRIEFPQLKRKLPTLWTNSYFVSTVGGATPEAVKQYIEDQKNA